MQPGKKKKKKGENTKLLTPVLGMRAFSPPIHPSIHPSIPRGETRKVLCLCTQHSQSNFSPQIIKMRCVAEYNTPGKFTMFAHHREQHREINTFSSRQHSAASTASVLLVIHYSELGMLSVLHHRNTWGAVFSLLGVLAFTWN